MRRITATAFSLVFIFVLTLASPVFAQDMTWEADYKWNGTVNLTRQVGHFCNTGAEVQHRISGEGEMTKSTDVYMKKYMMTHKDTNDFVTAANAIRNLTVTTSIKLCSPAKSVFASDIGMRPIEGLPGVEFSARKGDVIPVALLYKRLDSDLNGLINFLTEQIWAVQVAADPGFSGNLHQGFEAAYGPWTQSNFFFNDEETGWWFVDDEGNPATFLLDEIVGVEVGKDYVGNYFSIEQFARTSMGTVKRFIDISSPWSGAYLHEDMTVTGMSEVKEAFAMDNLPKGEAAAVAWWDLF